MLIRLVTSRRPPGPGRRFLAGAAVSVVFVPAGLGAAVLGELPAGANFSAPPAPEPRLGAPSPTPQPKRRPPSSWPNPNATVVKALAPGQAADVQPRAESRAPERIRKENAKLRRELTHLRALQAERRGVSRALSAAGAIDGGLLVGSGRLIWPIRGTLTSPFGPRWGRLHAGIDVGAPAGTPIRAADSGRVALAGPQGGYGLYTCVQHTPSLSTCYAHQSRLGTTSGASVRQGQVIGYVGNTGNSFGDHLHFETWVRGRPVDPMGFL